MRIEKVAVCVGVSVLVAALCWGFPVKSTVETFDGTLEEALWRMGANDEIVAEGGNPGAFLHDPSLASDAPSLATTGWPGPFTGLYRDMGVIGLGVDVQVFGTNPTADDRPVSLELRNNNNSPGDPTDDCIAVSVGKKLAQAERGWRSYSFHVPSYTTSLPNGWTVRGACADISPDAAWTTVMTFVAEARFVLGDPDVPYPVQVWDIGFDNPTIQFGKNRGSGPTLTEIEPSR